MINVHQPIQAKEQLDSEARGVRTHRRCGMPHAYHSWWDIRERSC